MSKSLQVKKNRQPRKLFIQRLTEKLNESKLGVVNVDMEDMWVELKIGRVILSFEFEKKGEQFERIGLFQETWECTGQQQIFAVSINDKKE